MSASPLLVSAATRARMQKVRRRDTPQEMAIRRSLHARGWRYRVDAAPLADLRRRADLVFGRQKVAVFCDGCFWHGCPEHGTVPEHNGTWWRAKIETTRRRDTNTTTRLENAGWVVVRIWEHELPDRAVARIETALHRREEVPRR
jgi:DNA mismatch endonuclease, patch repair protein